MYRTFFFFLPFFFHFYVPFKLYVGPFVVLLPVPHHELISLDFYSKIHFFIKTFQTSNKLKFNLFLQLLSIYILIYQSIKYPRSKVSYFSSDLYLFVIFHNFNWKRLWCFTVKNSCFFYLHNEFEMENTTMLDFWYKKD